MSITPRFRAPQALKGALKVEPNTEVKTNALRGNREGAAFYSVFSASPVQPFSALLIPKMFAPYTNFLMPAWSRPRRVAAKAVTVSKFRGDVKSQICNLLSLPPGCLTLSPAAHAPRSRRMPPAPARAGSQWHRIYPV
jgi:hypothetical protein